MPMRFMTRGRSAAGFTTAAALLLTLSACSSGAPTDTPHRPLRLPVFLASTFTA